MINDHTHHNIENFKNCCDFRYENKSAQFPEENTKLNGFRHFFPLQMSMQKCQMRCELKCRCFNYVILNQVLNGQIPNSQLLQVWIALCSGRRKGDEKIHKHCSSNGKIMHVTYVPSTKNNIQTKLNTKLSANIHCSLQKELTTFMYLFIYLFLYHPLICA